MEYTKEFVKDEPKHAGKMKRVDAVQKVNRGKKIKYTGRVLEKRKKRKDPMKKPTKVALHYIF